MEASVAKNCCTKLVSILILKPISFISFSLDNPSKINLSTFFRNSRLGTFTIPVVSMRVLDDDMSSSDVFYLGFFLVQVLYFHPGFVGVMVVRVVLGYLVGHDEVLK